jgi:very-short-patch-repair endonuclease
VRHRSAAELWGLLPERRGPIVVSVPGISGRQKRRGVHIHRSRTLAPEMVTNRGAVPVTTCERTFADLRRAAVTSGCPATVAPHELRHAIRQAEYMGLPVGSEPGADRTRSELEAKFLHLCRQHGLPAPEVNVKVGPLTVDFLWRDRRVVVETDGYRAHRGHQAFEDDRDRDLRLRALGYEVVRLSYRQVSEEPRRVAVALRAFLSP